MIPCHAMLRISWGYLTKMHLARNLFFLGGGEGWCLAGESKAEGGRGSCCRRDHDMSLGVRNVMLVESNQLGRGNDRRWYFF